MLTKKYAVFLSVFLSLFIIRVFAQLVVYFWSPWFLPAMEEWYSGLVSYPYLLTSQILIILLMVKMIFDVEKQSNFWGDPKRKLGEFLISFGSIYLVIMLLRYIMRMSLYPLERWTGGSIPIFFHWVLASFVLTLGFFHLLNSKPYVFSKFALWKRIILWFFIVVGMFIWATFQLSPTILAKIIHARQSECAVRIERSVGFKTSDGTLLVADIFHPQRIKNAPIILVRIPYAKVFVNQLFGNIIGRFWAERGYTVVIQGTRGRYESGGLYEPLLHEESDGKETLAWLKKQTWFSEKIGMWGGSYFGYTQLVLTDVADPKISAFIVQLSSTDFSKMFYTNGAFALESALQWALGSYGKIDRYPDNKTIDLASHSIPLISSDETAVQTKIPFLREWMQAPSDSAYWQKLDATKKFKDIQGPILSMAGWYDPFLQTQLENYAQLQKNALPEVVTESSLVIGPWSHARSVQLPDGFVPKHYRLESLEPSIEWFDRYLLGKKSKTQAAKVRIFVMGQNQWRNESEWPLSRAVQTVYFLNKVAKNNLGSLLQIKKENKKVSEHETDKETKNDKETEISDNFIYDPMNPLESSGGAMIGPNAGTFKQPEHLNRPDLLTYDTAELLEDTEVTGYPQLALAVKTTAPNTDFIARLIDVFPDGSAFNISDGILRKDFMSNQKNILKIQLFPTSYLFKKGHKIRIEVSSSRFPRFDRNFNSGKANYLATTYQKAKQTVFYGESYLVLPIIK